MRMRICLNGCVYVSVYVCARVSERTICCSIPIFRNLCMHTERKRAIIANTPPTPLAASFVCSLKNQTKGISSNICSLNKDSMRNAHTHPTSIDPFPLPPSSAI